MVLTNFEKVSQQYVQILFPAVEIYYKSYLNLQKKQIWVLIIEMKCAIIQISKKRNAYVYE